MDTLISFRENCEQAIKFAELNNEDKIEKYLMAANEDMEVLAKEYKRRSEFNAMVELQGLLMETVRKCKLILKENAASPRKKHGRSRNGSAFE